jgi:hypothetical protein
VLFLKIPGGGHNLQAFIKFYAFATSPPSSFAWLYFFYRIKFLFILFYFLFSSVIAEVGEVGEVPP